MTDLYELRTFSDIIEAIKEEVGVDANDTKITNRIKRDVNLIYLDEVCAKKRWPWLKRSVEVQHKAAFSTGTAAVTQNSVTVTLTESPSPSYRGASISVVGYNEVYRIEQHTSGSSTITLSSPYTGSTAAAASFKMWYPKLALPADCAETIEVSHGFMKRPLESQGSQDMHRIVAGAPKAEGRPSNYSTGPWVDPDPYDAISGLPATATRAATGLTRSLKFASTLGADEDSASIQPSDRLEISAAGHYSYNGQVVVSELSTTDNTNDTIKYTVEERKKETATADTGITVKKIDPASHREAYREMEVYPALNDTNTTLQVDYKIQRAPDPYPRPRNPGLWCVGASVGQEA
jgi:hypothetical protein